MSTKCVFASPFSDPDAASPSDNNDADFYPDEEIGPPAFVYVTAETKRFVCQICRKDFVTTQALKRHEQTLHSPNRERIPCSVCDAKFTRLDGIKKHMRKFHAGLELPHPKRRLLDDGDHLNDLDGLERDGMTDAVGYDGPIHDGVIMDSLDTVVTSSHVLPGGVTSVDVVSGVAQTANNVSDAVVSASNVTTV